MSVKEGLENGSKDDEELRHERTLEDHSLQLDESARLEDGTDIEEPDEVLPVVDVPATPARGATSDSYFDLLHDEDNVGGDRLDRVLRTPSPAASNDDTLSIPDDTPSPAGSYAALSPLSPSIRGISPRGPSRTPSGAVIPFERRFTSRFSGSPNSSPRAGSPAFLATHSRQSSLSSQIPSSNGDDRIEVSPAPWEVIRWTRLRKITGQAFSEIGKRQLGSPTCFTVSASIIIGTSKGLILIFDYNQNLKAIVGQGTKAAESGAVTSLAISADYSTVVGGHASGNIFTWEIAKPATPFLSIAPVALADKDENADGHLLGRAVLHIGFLGTRHTALVSADTGGMAFSHLATRGFGSLGRSVKTTRLLGRYPSANPQEDHHRKPSSVLAFAPLPLGNVEQSTDAMGLTALLTPYLLVIVSTTPLAQTQHKASRPRDVAAHGAMSACLAWFPAVRLKTTTNDKDVSETKLVYCWSDVLTVLDVEIGAADRNDKDRHPSLSFQPRSRWRCEEAIVAVQWLSRSVIGVLTISQRLIILEDGELHVMDSVDLMQRHIYHKDLFSKQLHTVVEQEENEAVIHGVVADAFYMSFRAYKGRLFLMGIADISVGTLSNWADRLSAMVEHGDDIGAVNLATSYYNGRIGKVSVGLPEDDASRHAMVKERLMELLTATLRYRLSDQAAEDGRIQELTDVCFDACLMTDEVDYLLGDAYEYFDEGGQRDIFINTLETSIMEGNISALPPPLVKDVVAHYSASQRETRLEEILCRVDAHTFDIEQVTRLCKEHLLVDALIYVWNQALSDWVSPLSDLLILVRDMDITNGTTNYDHDDKIDAASKIFPYLAFSLTGRQYPKGDAIDSSQADAVRDELYKVLFSAGSIYWPPGARTRLKTRPSSEDEPAFPYLQLLLRFDTSSFMSMLNESFEDPFLNSNQDQDYDGFSPMTPNGQASHMTRQQIISILFEIMTEDDFDAEQIAYLDMFIARSLPKYSQFLVLSGSTLEKILARLCAVRSAELADESQLSVECLLSVYHPAMSGDLLELIHDAGFYRVLKSIHRSSRHYLELIMTYFEDPDDREGIFVDLRTCLRSALTKMQRQAIEDLLCGHAQDLIFIDLPQSAQLVQAFMSHRLDDFLRNLPEPRLQYAFLQQLLEAGPHSPAGRDTPASRELILHLSSRYIKLMCSHDPAHVADYVSSLESADLHLQDVLPMMEKTGVVDAAVLLLAKEGLAREAIHRLVKHVTSLQVALMNLIETWHEDPQSTATEVAVSDLVKDVEKYIKLGIWLCQGQTAVMPSTPMSPVEIRRRNQEVVEGDLTLDEYLWLSLVDTAVKISKTVSSGFGPADTGDTTLKTRTTTLIRSLVQQVFTALLASTSAPNRTASLPQPSSNLHPSAPPSQPSGSTSFIPIFRCFLTRAARTAPSIQDLGTVLSDIFATYAHEADLLSLAAHLLDADAFAEISAVQEARQHGWRAKAQVCDKCKRRAWGPGIGEAVFEAWVDGETSREAKRRDDAVVRAARRGEEQRDEAAAAMNARGAKGKGKHASLSTVEFMVGEEQLAERQRLALVLFACKHLLHRQCLDAMGPLARRPDGRYKCPSCEQERSAVAQDA